MCVSQVIRSVVRTYIGPEMPCLAPYVFVLLGLMSASPGQNADLPQLHRGILLGRPVSVAVLALPSSMDTITITQETRDFADGVAEALRSEHFQVVVAYGVPLEELTATANSRQVDVALGVLSLEGSTRCPALLAPAPIPLPEPTSFRMPGDEAVLARYIRELTASSRSKESARLAAALSSSGTWCDRTPSETETYLLEGTHAPTVIMSVATGDADSLTERIPSAIEEWLAPDGG
jgi:hypothetical protein